MTEPIEVTEEMRQAVYAADCELHGHMPDVSAVLVVISSLPINSRPKGNDTAPYITCQRCHKVWLVIDEPEVDYEKAMEKLKGRLRPEDKLNKKKNKVPVPPNDEVG